MRRGASLWFELCHDRRERVCLFVSVVCAFCVMICEAVPDLVRERKEEKTWENSIFVCCVCECVSVCRRGGREAREEALGRKKLKKF